MDNQQLDQALVKFAEQFEEFSKTFSVAFANSASIQDEKWYTVRAMTLRLLKVSAVASPVELRTLFVALHGAIACLGFSGTLKLVLEMRRKHGGRTKIKKA